MRYTPTRCTPVRYMPVRYTPIRCTPSEMYVHEMHAHEVHACEMHVYEVHAHEGFYEYLARQNTVAHLFHKKLWYRSGCRAAVLASSSTEAVKQSFRQLFTTRSALQG